MRAGSAEEGRPGDPRRPGGTGGGGVQVAPEVGTQPDVAGAKSPKECLGDGAIKARKPGDALPNTYSQRNVVSKLPRVASTNN